MVVKNSLKTNRHLQEFIQQTWIFKKKEERKNIDRWIESNNAYINIQIYVSVFNSWLNVV